ncbi:Transcriptional regulator, contains XRE-family HTH domain [Mucilaginibacter gossypiicola]|uniref:Transcriptional regulator, contains XRE-family HTH domain n=1 Tax=Mucilaginibacter gossypiicola TaxID=551995 RepID=A0A1H8LVQ2_9SPHI|nr:helix-turn-helix transcriptional regulator [Mucilaginibacter gossypiicola]SEO09161.1 Transcriptional regulator, contains XRE-family HTH domain [Mucilaginibacter gossypiicola]
MAKRDNRNNVSDANNDNQAFYLVLGAFIKTLRVKAGFPTPEAFANIAGMTRSQYSAYENGKNLTLITFRNLLLEFNIKVEDWLNLSLIDPSNDSEKIIFNIRQARIDQVIEQVKIIENHDYSYNLGSKAAQRYIDILIFCHTAKSRHEILTKLLEMDDSVNTLKRVAGKLIDYGWLELTDPSNRNNPNQKYITSLSGKSILSLRS